MNRKAKFGWILVAGLTLVIFHQPQAKQPIKMPSDLVIVARQATWDEKQENRRIAKAYASAGWGWSGREWLCLHDLWTRESRFDHLASNQQGSSAFGIAQMLGEESRDPGIQILRGLRYISERYTTPCKAFRFHQRNNHY